MPLYEYGCQACGKRSEIVQKFSDPVEKVCPQCGKPALEKLISATSFTLKGGGWYATDYKKPASETKAPATTVPITGTAPATPSGPASSSSTGSKGDGGSST